MTQLEFTDLMREVATIADHQQSLRGTRPLYMFDNPSVHIGADLTAVGISQDQILPIAPYSPDFNKPIEHTFGILKGVFRKYLYDDCEMGREEIPPAKLQRDLKHMFMSEIHASVVMADAYSLPDTWDVVRSAEGRAFVGRNGKTHIGSNGDWPRKRDR